MKTRQGFISNSSTCSFVVAGVKLTKKQQEEVEAKITNGLTHKDDEYWEVYEEWREKSGLRFVEFKGQQVLGVTILHISNEDYLEDNEIDIAAILAKAATELRKLGIDQGVSIFAGTESC